MSLAKIVFLPVSFLFLASLERFFLILFPFVSFAPPLLVLGTTYWFFSFSQRGRFFLAGVVGVALDSLSLFPFGTYAVMMTMFAAASLLAEQNAADSATPLFRIFWGSFVLLSEPVLLYIVGAILSFLRGAPVYGTLTGAFFAFFLALFWAATFLACAGGVLVAAGRKKA